MTLDNNSIREVNIERDNQGKIQKVTVVFGPHYYIEVQPDEHGVLSLYMGATHHGFAAPANDVGKGLESIIEEIRKNHPDLTTD